MTFVLNEISLFRILHHFPLNIVTVTGAQCENTIRMKKEIFFKSSVKTHTHVNSRFQRRNVMKNEMVNVCRIEHRIASIKLPESWNFNFNSFTVECYVTDNKYARVSHKNQRFPTKWNEMKWNRIIRAWCESFCVCICSFLFLCITIPKSYFLIGIFCDRHFAIHTLDEFNSHWIHDFFRV